MSCVHAVRVVAAGDALLSPGVTKQLITEFAARAKEPQDAARLDGTHRPRARGHGLVAEGLSNDEIAERLVRESRHREDAREPGDGQAPARETAPSSW